MTDDEVSNVGDPVGRMNDKAPMSKVPVPFHKLENCADSVIRGRRSAPALLIHLDGVGFVKFAIRHFAGLPFNSNERQHAGIDRIAGHRCPRRICCFTTANVTCAIERSISRDFGYDVVVRVCLQFFARSAGLCPVIPPELRGRFVD